MWRPEQRIKWSTAPGPWPTTAQANASLLFSPLTSGPLHVDSRIWVPAMVPWRASSDGYVTTENVEWYRRFAESAPGTIVVEATGIRDVSSGKLLRIGDDKFIEGLSKIANAIHDASGGKTRALIQLIDFLAIKRRPSSDAFFSRFLKIKQSHKDMLDLPQATEMHVRNILTEMTREELKFVLDERELESLDMGYRERVTDVELTHIKNLPEQLPTLFANAAIRAQEAGFDGVELHYAHAYTMASFLSALNTRNDGWGSSREGRVRLPLEVYRAVRQAVGSEFVVGCRFLTDEIIAGGTSREDARFFATEFARAGMDFLSLSRGGKFEDAQQPKPMHAAYPYTGRSGYECMPQYISDEQGPFGRNVRATTEIRSTLRAAGLQTPVVVAGGIYDFATAEELLTSGSADLVGLARQSLADPDWPEKVRTGHGAEVRLCRYTNYCEALDARHEAVTCELWDRVNLMQVGVAKTSDGKRRLLPERTQRKQDDDIL